MFVFCSRMESPLFSLLCSCWHERYAGMFIKSKNDRIGENMVLGREFNASISCLLILCYSHVYFFIEENRRREQRSFFLFLNV